MTIVLATRNRKKVEELTRMFAGCDVRFVTLDTFPGCPDVVEDGKTFRANALKKALVIAGYTGCPALADDSGLEIEALGGEPGVLSARYAGEKSDDRQNVKKVIRRMKHVEDNKRAARFVCCIAFALPDGQYKTFFGYSKGVIAYRPVGRNGFGYDPIFYPLGCDRTFAQMTAAEKDALSHRGKAMKKLFRFLKERL
jgi:XTP/dITP diphosphohydrolase